MATHSSTLAWKIPWTEEPAGLQSMGLQRVSDLAHTQSRDRHDKTWGPATELPSVPRSRALWRILSEDEYKPYHRALLGAVSMSHVVRKR